jgi:hypothetical protein
MAYIMAGWGYDVGNDFARATRNTPIELAPTEYAKPGCAVGYIAGDPDSHLGFLRRARVRVHVLKRAIAYDDKQA